MDKLEDLLVRTSRTFALSIPLLPEPLRREVTVAYVLFRIADTFEDAVKWPPERKIGALQEFSELLRRPSPERATELGRRWTEVPPLDHRGYLDLLSESGYVTGEFLALSTRSREVQTSHLVRTAAGMAEYVSRSRDTGWLELQDVADLRRYCYYVAGIVGEMLTKLFLLHEPDLRRAAGFLERRARFFGEGLQLVNILKDADTDRVEGRVYLPPTVPRSQVVRLAGRDLDRAAEYVLAMQRSGASRGLVAFNALPVLLARATLDVVEERPGRKISRAKVFSLTKRMNRALDRGEPVVPAPGRKPVRAQRG